MLRRSAHARGEVERFAMARTVLGRPVYVTSCYRLGPWLVDAGSARGATRLRAALGDAPRAVLLTHGHEDHVGGAGLLGAGRVLGAPGLAVARGLPGYRRAAWGEPAPLEPAPAEPVSGAGHALEPVPTPGHTPDHLAWHEPARGWVFAGDAALGMLRYGMRGEDLGAYMASLRAILDLRPETVFPSHGPVLERPAEQLGAQLRHLEGLRDAARRLAREGLGEAAIARRLLGLDGWMRWASRGEFGKALLVRHLLEAP